MDDKIFDECEICEKDRELIASPSATGYWVYLCWECLGEVECWRDGERP